LHTSPYLSCTSTPTSVIYTLSLHDALPIYNKGQILSHILGIQEMIEQNGDLPVNVDLVIEGEEEIGSANLGKFLSQNREALKCKDRKSTRLNSSHLVISYAVFCLKKKTRTA